MIKFPRAFWTAALCAAAACREKEASWRGYSFAQVADAVAAFERAGATPEERARAADMMRRFFTDFTHAERDAADAAERKPMLEAARRVVFAVYDLDYKDRPIALKRADLWRAVGRAAAAANDADCAGECEWRVGRGLLEDFANPHRRDDARGHWTDARPRVPDLYKLWIDYELAALARDAGDWDAADAAVERGIAAAAGAAPSLAAAYLYGERAQERIDLGLHELARADLRAAEDALRRTGRADPFAQCNYDFIAFACDLGSMNFEGALETARASLEKCARGAYAGVRDAEAQFRAFAAVAEGELALRGGDRAALERCWSALASVVKADGAAARVRGTTFNAHIAFAVELHHWDEARAAAAARAASMGPNPGALESAELTSIEARLARVAPPEATGEEKRAMLAKLDGALSALIAQWASAVRKPRRGGTGFLHFAFRRRLLTEYAAYAIDVLGPKAGAEAALDAVVRCQQQGTLARALDAPAPPADWRARCVRKDGGWLLYAAAPEDTYLFIIERGEVSAVRLAGTRALDRLVLDARRGLESPAGNDGDTAALDGVLQSLDAMLIPAEARAKLERWHSAVICGADMLFGAPFEALPSLRAKAVSRMPSVPVACFLEERSAARPPASALELTLAAAPPSDAPAERAPFSVDDDVFKRLASGYASTRDARGAACTASALRASTGILQIVTHGLYAPELERPAALLIAPDASHPSPRLTCDDVERLWNGARAPRLVIATACGSARGPARRGDDGGHHLGGAFLTAGADAALVCPADLELAPALAYLEVLHRELAGGASPAAASANARRALMDTPRRRHPRNYSLPYWVGVADRPASGKK